MPNQHARAPPTTGEAGSGAGQPAQTNSPQNDTVPNQLSQHMPVPVMGGMAAAAHARAGAVNNFMIDQHRRRMAQHLLVAGIDRQSMALAAVGYPQMLSPQQYMMQQQIHQQHSCQQDNSFTKVAADSAAAIAAADSAAAVATAEEAKKVKVLNPQGASSPEVSGGSHKTLPMKRELVPAEVEQGPLKPSKSSKIFSKVSDTEESLPYSPLIGPFVQGIRSDSKNIQEDLEKATRIGPLYFLNQIKHLRVSQAAGDSFATPPTIQLSIADAKNLAFVFSADKQKYAKMAVEFAYLEMVGRHENVRKEMLKFIRSLGEDNKSLRKENKELQIAASGTGQSVNPSAELEARAGASMTHKNEIRQLQKFLDQEKAKEIVHKNEIRQMQKSFEQEKEKQEEAHKEVINRLLAQMAQEKETHRHCLNSYIKASVEVLKLVRKEENGKIL